jgi:steroid delta-isomerase-like uncharacterized protein
MTTLQLAQTYYQHFNQKNWDGMLSMLHPAIQHHTNQGPVREGIAKFEAFLQHMDTCYAETLTDMRFYTEPSNSHIAVQFTVNGIYKHSDSPELPPASGQAYQLPAAAFLEFTNGQISKITTYYNLALWIELVSQ